MGRYGKAVTDCTKAIELDPQLAMAYSNRGCAYVGTGRYGLAVTDCTKAIEPDPRLPMAYINRA